MASNAIAKLAEPSCNAGQSEISIAKKDQELQLQLRLEAGT